MRLSLAHMDVSPRGIAFLLPILDAEPELEGRECSLLLGKMTILITLNALAIEVF
jgi:hypothetical protein